MIKSKKGAEVGIWIIVFIIIALLIGGLVMTFGSSLVVKASGQIEKLIPNAEVPTYGAEVTCEGGFEEGNKRCAEGPEGEVVQECQAPGKWVVVDTCGFFEKCEYNTCVPASEEEACTLVNCYSTCSQQCNTCYCPESSGCEGRVRPGRTCIELADASLTTLDNCGTCNTLMCWCVGYCNKPEQTIYEDEDCGGKYFLPDCDTTCPNTNCLCPSGCITPEGGITSKGLTCGGEA